MAKAKMTFAVCGYGGAFGMGRRHAGELHDTGRMQLVAVCDPDPARQEAAAQDFPGIDTYDDLKTLLAKSEAQLVVVVTPHNLHGPQAIQCLRAGRHVVLEKPMCLTTRQADTMIRLARQRRRLLSVYHNRRWDGDYLALRKVVDGGSIGEVFNVRCEMAGLGMRTDWWRARKRITGGAMYDWGAHITDWILQMVPSKVESVCGVSQKRLWMDADIEDEVYALIRFKNGVVGEILISHIRDVARRAKWQVMGTKGHVLSRWRDNHLEVTTRRKGRRITEHVPNAKGEARSYYRNVVAHLFERKPLAVTAGSAARAIAVIEAQMRSARTGREVPIKDR